MSDQQDRHASGQQQAPLSLQNIRSTQDLQAELPVTRIRGEGGWEQNFEGEFNGNRRTCVLGRITGE
ncbi:MAG: hypothetical protein ABI217_12735 [Chthoniobacterales bacterium]